MEAHGSPSEDNREAQTVQRRSPGLTKEKPMFNNRSPCFTIHFDINNRSLNRVLSPVPNSGLVRDWFWDQYIVAFWAPMVMSELDLCLIEKCLSLTEELSNTDITVGAKPDYTECN